MEQKLASALGVIVAAWGAAYTLRLFDAPSMDRSGSTEVAAEVAALLQLGEQHLHFALRDFNARVTIQDKVILLAPLGFLLFCEMPLVELLEHLSFQPVLAINDFSAWDMDHQ